MQIHKEGYKAIFISGVLLSAIVAPLAIFASCYLPIVLALLFWIFIIRFFRVPNRKTTVNDKAVLSPADGKIVTIEETFESEFFGTKLKQISVFMSVWNVHQNLSPVNGTVIFYKYHPGLFLLARNPKSSHENERTTIALETPSGVKLLMRQIAGIAARRIICKAEKGLKFKQNQEIGFIKFGSRVDVFLPLDAKISVTIGDKVKGGISVLAEI